MWQPGESGLITAMRTDNPAFEAHSRQSEGEMPGGWLRKADSGPSAKVPAVHWQCNRVALQSGASSAVRPRCGCWGDHWGWGAERMRKSQSRTRSNADSLLTKKLAMSWKAGCSVSHADANGSESCSGLGVLHLINCECPAGPSIQCARRRAVSETPGSTSKESLSWFGWHELRVSALHVDDERAPRETLALAEVEPRMLENSTGMCYEAYADLGT